jgi:hypothetical protein
MSLGDKEQVFAMLDKGLQEHSADMIFLATAPEFDSLHEDPRFRRIEARIGFPDSAMTTPASKATSSH